MAFAESDIASVAGKYKINQVLGQYHSALEHTLRWVVDVENPHLIEQFCIIRGSRFSTICGLSP